MSSDAAENGGDGETSKSRGIKRKTRADTKVFRTSTRISSRQKAEQSLETVTVVTPVNPITSPKSKRKIVKPKKEKSSVSKRPSGRRVESSPLNLPSYDLISNSRQSQPRPLETAAQVSETPVGLARSFEVNSFPAPLEFSLQPVAALEVERYKSVPTAMEQSWPTQGYYNYFPGDSQAARSAERIPPSHSPHQDDANPRRTTSASYLPSSSSESPQNNMNLPPFSQTFYSSSYQTSPTHGSHAQQQAQGSGGGPQGGQGGGQPQPQHQSHIPHSHQHHGAMGYGSHMPMGPPGPGAYPYPVQSPISISAPPLPGQQRGGPPHSYSESPRLAGYSSSPGLHHLSPVSPNNHLVPPGLHHSSGGGPSSASTSSSSFASASVPRNSMSLPSMATSVSGGSMSGPGMGKLPNLNVPHQQHPHQRHNGSPAGSNESWEEEGSAKYPDGYSSSAAGNAPAGNGGGTGRRRGKTGGTESDDMPWGMPQEEYKALNPRDKKQVRNRIGARRFRAKRKDYVSNLEGSIRVRDDEIGQLRAQVEQQRNDINDLRARLGMPPLPPLPPPPHHPHGNDGALGLVVTGTE